MYMMYSVFFFSSRRRHTRFKCDWSSDVCSSDLHEAELAQRRAQAHAAGGAVGQGLEKLVLLEVAVEQQVLAVVLGGIVRQTGHDLAGLEVDPLLALAPAHDQGPGAAVVERPLQEVARRKRGESTGEFHVCRSLYARDRGPDDPLARSGEIPRTSGRAYVPAA